MKYKMKGHALPGIKQFKSTKKQDGRAASSAFQAHESGHDDTGGPSAGTRRTIGAGKEGEFEETYMKGGDV